MKAGRKMSEEALGGGGWGAAEREEEPAVQNTTAVLLLSRVHQNHFEGDGAGTVKNTDACTPTCAPLKKCSLLFPTLNFIQTG